VKQVDNFAATRAAMEQKLGRRELNKLIPKSIFLLSFGTKDLFHVWYLQNLRAMEEPASRPYSMLASRSVGGHQRPPDRLLAGGSDAVAWPWI
jgi:hypothetical protein